MLRIEYQLTQGEEDVVLRTVRERYRSGGAGSAEATVWLKNVVAQAIAKESRAQYRQDRKRRQGALRDGGV